MEYPPPDWFTPKAKAAKRAPPARKKLKLSKQATDALARFKQSLEDWPVWMHSTSGSVMIEYLVWLFENSERRYRGFHPETRNGRPAGPNYMENFRPATQRKAAGLTIADARLGPERPKE